LALSIANILSNRVGVIWTTTGHTAVDILLFANGQDSTTRFNKGIMNNNDVGVQVSDYLGLDLAAVTASLANFSPFPPSPSSSDAFEARVRDSIRHWN